MSPAELEGHLLNHPDVDDVCVVGVPDDYSGEVPLAFVVPSKIAAKRIEKDPKAADKIKTDLIKVCYNSSRLSRCFNSYSCIVRR